MKHFQELLVCSITLTLYRYCNAQSTAASSAGDNLKAFVAGQVREYSRRELKAPYHVPEHVFRGGDFSSQYIVSINETRVKFDANWNQAPEVTLHDGAIMIQFSKFFEYKINGTYSLEGLQNFYPVIGNGDFGISSNLTELIYYYFYTLDAFDHVSIDDVTHYYSNNMHTFSFSFMGTNSSEHNYQRSFAHAISEYSLRNMALYHQNNLEEFLKCVFEAITLEEIELGGDVDSDLCIANPDPTDHTQEETSVTTTSTPSPTILPTLPSTTTQISTSTPGPDVPFDCSGRPDGYYQHPSNCSKFLGCLNGRLIQYTCPTFLIFHPDRLTCVHPNEYTCPFGIFSCTGRADGYYASPASCTDYFGCLDEMIFKELVCPGGYYFDERGQKCVSPSVSDCYTLFELFEEAHSAFQMQE